MQERHAAVLFDFFDTLCRIDEAAYLAGKAEEARLLGLPLEIFLREWIAAGDLAQTGALPDVASRVRHTLAALGAPPPDEATVGRVVRLEERTLIAGTSLYADALPVLETLAVPRRSGRIRIGLVSNASCTGALLFERLGLAPFFDHALFSFQAGMMKPQPGIYLRACETLGVPPGACLFVGDGNGGELDGALGVGMEAVRIERPVSLGPYRKRESLRYSASVRSLAAIAGLLRS